jgi:polyribonucleotide nucleotidyltransferase
MEETSQSRQVVIKQADGSVVVRIGKTVILGTVVSSSKSGIDFTLTADCQKICRTFPGGFKREARPSDSEVNNEIS